MEVIKIIVSRDERNDRLSRSVDMKTIDVERLIQSILLYLTGKRSVEDSDES